VSLDTAASRLLDELGRGRRLVAGTRIDEEEGAGD
jgi:hypothetical protein